MGILLPILIVGVLIIIHEFGHFIVAKGFGMGVTTFSVGFGRKILSKRVGETTYQISSIPLGGYVRFAGDEEGNDVSRVDPQRFFNSKPAWQRLCVLLAGPTFNLFSAPFFFALGYIISGIPELTTRIEIVYEGLPAQGAGILPGDSIISIGGMYINTWDEVSDLIMRGKDELQILVYRGDDLEPIMVDVVPVLLEGKNIFEESVRYYGIGIKPTVGTVRDPFRALKEGVLRTIFIVKINVVALQKLIRGQLPKDNLGGPIRIVQIGGEIYNDSGFTGMLFFAAGMSIAFCVFNLLPIPILDGGQIPFLLIEMVRGKPVSQKVQIFVQKIGLLILVFLIVFIFYNDITRLIK